jgi:hypothetical protein
VGNAVAESVEEGTDTCCGHSVSLLMSLQWNEKDTRTSPVSEDYF